MLVSAASAFAAPTLFPVEGINYAILNEKEAYVYNAVDTAKLVGDIVIPEKVTLDSKEYILSSIGSVAFKDCKRVTSFQLPSTLTQLGLQAFNGCSALKSVNLQDTKITNLQVSTFLSCTSLEAITIPATVDTIGINPFTETLSLKAIEVAPGNKSFKSIDGVLFTISGKTLISFPAGKTVDYVVPEGTDTIAQMAFCMARHLQTVKFPESLTRLENQAFMRVDDLTKIELPKGIKYIGESAFSECKKATGDIVVPEGTKVLLKAFFYTAISSLELPGSLSSIPTSVAQYCVKLRSIVMNEGISSIGQNAFNTTAISEIEIPNSVTKIGSSAFEGCTLLSNITFGEKLRTVDIRAFYNLKKIANIDVLATTPPTLSGTVTYPAFTETVLANCNVIVPAGCEEAYKAADVWKDFKNLESSGVEQVEAKNIGVQAISGGLAVLGADNAMVEVYNMSGMLIYKGSESIVMLPAKGVYLVRVEGKTFKIAI